MLGLILAYFAHYGRVKAVIVAKENVALRSLGAYLADFIPVSRGLEAPKIVGRFCGAEEFQRVSESRTPFDIHPDHRRDYFDVTRIVLVTSGVLCSQLYRERRCAPHMAEAILLCQEESQQYGGLTETLAIAATARRALRFWSGDERQTPWRY